MQATSQIVSLNQWTLRMRLPDAAGPHPVILLLHGLTGDENSMWFFAPRLPSHYLLIAPRGIYPVQPSGYSWRLFPAEAARTLPVLEDFRSAVAALYALLTPQNFPDADFSHLHLMGFSQGAALSYAFALSYPGRIQSVAALAGFAPAGTEALIKTQPLLDKPVFIAHGLRDETISIQLARQARQLMQQAGADVCYCEDDVGHKVGVRCFPALDAFYPA